MKSTFDLILDVRTYSEYVGDGDETCNAGKANKCNMGHDPDMWHLVNTNRDDKATLYDKKKVDGTSVYTVDEAAVKALGDCYGAKAKTMKICVSCHSGARSAAMQDALVAAGFTCGNIYNLRPGADGLWKADPSKLVKGNAAKGAWSCSAARDTCTNEIDTVDAFYSMKSTFDLILDVRTYSEYVGDGDETCNAGKANKCNMGHDPDMWHLVNTNRDDKATLYDKKKVDGTSVYTVDEAAVKALGDCYGAKAKTMKICVSCHSGARSAAMQDALVAAGFTCGNIYNLRPGADGLWKADPSKLVKGNAEKGAWSCSAAPVTTFDGSDASASSKMFAHGALSTLFFMGMFICAA